MTTERAPGCQSWLSLSRSDVAMLCRPLGVHVLVLSLLVLSRQTTLPPGAGYLTALVSVNLGANASACACCCVLVGSEAICLPLFRSGFV